MKYSIIIMAVLAGLLCLCVLLVARNVNIIYYIINCASICLLFMAFIVEIAFNKIDHRIHSISKKGKIKLCLLLWITISYLLFSSSIGVMSIGFAEEVDDIVLKIFALTNGYAGVGLGFMLRSIISSSSLPRK